jgi:hypothetical protein
MATLQVKGMDDRLYEALGALASTDRRSVSQEVVSMIEDFLARRRPAGQEATAAFLELAGTWEDRRSAARIASDIRRARRTGARSRRLADVLD